MDDVWEWMTYNAVMAMSAHSASWSSEGGVPCGHSGADKASWRRAVTHHKVIKQ